MMNIEARINQFKTMADADPENELGHFSLAKAYVDAQRYAEAEPAFQRVVQINPGHSKAYQLLGETQLKLNRRDQALTTLRRGYEVAAQRGDVQPGSEIGQLLSELGEAIPTIETRTEGTAAAEKPSSQGAFRCRRCERPHGKLPQRPFKGELGEKIWANICSDCWREWVGMGTKVINEMGLQLADPRSQATYDQYMREFLQLEE